MITCIFESGKNASLRHVTVDALVIDQNKILLVKRAPHLSNGNKWASPGGFLGRDENTKEAVVREVKEETGYKVKVEELFFITDKPDRKNEDRQNVSFTYLVKPISGIDEHDDEVLETKWFSLNELPDESEFAFDHFGRIKLYLKYRNEKFSLPVIES